MKSASPVQGFGRIAERPEDILLLCFYDPHGISTVPETVAFMQSESRFSITVINLGEHRQRAGYFKLRPQINLERYKALIIHNSLSYNVDNLRGLDSDLTLKFKDFRGVKVLMKQDENFRFRELAKYIGETGFDLILTCLPAEAIEKVYPPELVGTPRFERMLTSYVTPTLRNQKFENERPIDICYRGSIQPLSFGRLAYEKRLIGEDIKSLLGAKGLNLNISSRWEDRIGGDAWFDFLRSSKATLGVESGASIFDLDGNLNSRISDIESRLGPYKEDLDYAERYLQELSDIEGNVYYNQISPRHFEAISTGTIQLLFPGDFSKILVPGRHYFQLERDYSNLDLAVELLRDESRRSAMAKCAFNEVILNEANWIETFVSRLDNHVDKLLALKNFGTNIIIESDGACKNILLISAHKPQSDPQLSWIEQCVDKNIHIHQLRVLPPSERTPKTEKTSRGALVLSYPKKQWVRGTCTQLFSKAGLYDAGIAGIQELLFIENALNLSEDKFCTLFGAPSECERNTLFRQRLNYFLDTTMTLLDTAMSMRGIDGVIATDLSTLCAALVLKGVFGVPVFYDTRTYDPRTYRPENDLTVFEYEKQFWVGMERRFVTYSDYCQTDSPDWNVASSALYANVIALTRHHALPVSVKLFELDQRPYLIADVRQTFSKKSRMFIYKISRNIWHKLPNRGRNLLTPLVKKVQLLNAP